MELLRWRQRLLRQGFLFAELHELVDFFRLFLRMLRLALILLFTSSMTGPMMRMPAPMRKQPMVGKSNQKLVRLAWVSARCRSVVRRELLVSRRMAVALLPSRSDCAKNNGEVANLGQTDAVGQLSQSVFEAT